MLADPQPDPPTSSGSTFPSRLQVQTSERHQALNPAHCRQVPSAWSGDSFLAPLPRLRAVSFTPSLSHTAGRACATIYPLLQAVASCFPVMAHKASCSWIALLPALLPMALTLPASAHHQWQFPPGTQSIERSAKNTKSDPDANLWNEIATVPVSSEAKTLKNEVMLNKIFAGTPGSVWKNIPDDFSYRHDYYIYGKALAATILPMGRKSTSDVMPQAHEPRSLPWYPVRHA